MCVSWPDVSVLPRLDRVLERSMIVCLLGLLRTERLAREMSAVTLVMGILGGGEEKEGEGQVSNREQNRDNTASTEREL